ncbi:MAG: chemotaxis response regulator protein-glutamate methylesterase [Pseudomonadota bacterium]
MIGARRIRVLIIDDSLVVRETLVSLIEDHPQLEIMGTAIDPFEAAERIRHEVPDVITLDIEMPRMDGITFLRRLMQQKPLPVIVCSSRVGAGSPALIEALDAGAVDVIPKPAVGTRQFLEESAIRIQDKIIAAANARLNLKTPQATIAKRTGPSVQVRASAGSSSVIAIGASTGGTEALKYVLSSLPADTPPVIIVQHMPEHFTSAFASHLNEICSVNVREAAHGDRLTRGHVLIAPGDKHLELHRTGQDYRVKVVDGPLVSRHRPSVDVLFRSTAKFAGANAIGVILTGMGQDGADGLKTLRDAGARTIGQNEASCVVYGMPRVAKSLGAVEVEADLRDIPHLLFEILGRHAA